MSNTQNEAIRQIAGSINDDPDTLFESEVQESAETAAKNLEQSYKENIRMLEQQVRLAEKRSKMLKDLYKRLEEQLDVCWDALERDAKSFRAIAEVFSNDGFQSKARQCLDKAEQCEELVARAETFKKHIEGMLSD